MKNKKRLFLLLTLSLGILLSSCHATGSGDNTDGNETAPTPAMSSQTPETPAVSTPSPSLPTAPVSGFEFKKKTFSDGTITVTYPQIAGIVGTAQEKLNKMIADAALRDVKDLEMGTQYELNYKVTYNTPSVISMYFTGYGNVPGTAHPYQFLRAVTIDTEKQETIKLSDIINVDASFVQFMLNGQYSSMSYDMTEEYRSSIKEYLTSLGEIFWLDELKNADTPGYGTASYLTEEGLVISISVPYAMGDHVEITLNYKDLVPYKTDSPVWKGLDV